MRAAKVSDATFIELLLDKGADPNLRLRNQTTALMIAASRAGRNAGPEQNTIDAMPLLLAEGRRRQRRQRQRRERAARRRQPRRRAGEVPRRARRQAGPQGQVRADAARRGDGRSRCRRRRTWPRRPRPAVQPAGPVRESTAALLKELMAARGLMKVRRCEGATVRRCAPSTARTSHPRTSLSSASSCGESSTPAGPSVERVSGVWMAHATLTSVSGGACVGSALQASIGNRDIFAALDSAVECHRRPRTSALRGIRQVARTPGSATGPPSP